MPRRLRLHVPGGVYHVTVAAYREFVDARVDLPWEPAQVMAPGVAVLGNDDFIARVTRSSRVATRCQSLAELIDEACRRFEIEREALASPVRNAYLARVRAWIGFQAGKRGVATLAAVARELGRTEGALRYVIRAYPDEME